MLQWMVLIFFSVLIYIKISVTYCFFYNKKNKTIKVILNRNNEDKEKVWRVGQDGDQTEDP